MSDSHISDDVFRAGVLSTMAAGLGLWTYSQFFKKKSYLVEWRARVAPYTSETGDDAATTNLDDPEQFFGPVGWVTGTATFTERPVWAKSHTDVFDRVFDIVCKHEKFQNIAPEKILVEIPHIHVL